MTPISYSEPELCTYNGDMSKSWFVYFDIVEEATGQTLRKQFRGGINYYITYKERMIAGKQLRREWSQTLKSGLYNPFKPRPEAPPNSISIAIETVLALKKTSLKVKSYRNYKDITKMFIGWLKTRGYTHLYLHQFSGPMAQAYMDHLILERKYNGKSHNNQLGILRAFFNVMAKKPRRWIPENPFDGIIDLPEDIGKNHAYTDKERDFLQAFFKEHDKRMYFAINFPFHGFIRKTELTHIRVGDINWENRTIKMSSSDTKNRIQDSVTITEGLYTILLEMGLDLAPKEYYIFGKGLQTCAEKLTRPDDLSDRHLALKRKAGLKDDPNKAYYSWKHTGVVAYWRVIKDPYFMMRQLRHSDLKTTMIYLKSLGLMPNEAFQNATIKI